MNPILPLLCLMQKLAAKAKLFFLSVLHSATCAIHRGRLPKAQGSILIKLRGLRPRVECNLNRMGTLHTHQITITGGGRRLLRPPRICRQKMMCPRTLGCFHFEQCLCCIPLYTRYDHDIDDWRMEFRKCQFCSAFMFSSQYKPFVSITSQSRYHGHISTVFFTYV